MTHQTKLVNCGSKVFIYDFNCRKKIKELGFEQDVIQGNIIYLERLTLTNFVNNTDSLIVKFRLRITLSDYWQAKDKIDIFLNHLMNSSGYKQVQYLAVAEIPTTMNACAAHLHLVTSITPYDLTRTTNQEMTEDEEEVYFEELWGDSLSMDIYSPEDLLSNFISTYEKSLDSKVLQEYPKIFLSSRLKQPVILWNKDAETFIREHNVLDFPIHRSSELYDRECGYVTINQYSLDRTNSFLDVFDYFLNQK
ncbi:hypothetical protein [Metabacillus sp. Hm71]|uniref:hypothetical protein n=1 Tax=Metabacillus sp. Hm71 TaxID=3450743 RepID=UPI003F41DDAF